MNRVPGNFHIEARSKAHNLNAVMTNLSHVVNHLSFGPLHEPDVLSRLERFSSEFYVTNVLDDRMFVLEEFHKAHHHYIKVVGTLYETPATWGKSQLLTYQVRRRIGKRERERERGPEGKREAAFFLVLTTHPPSPALPAPQILPETSVMTYGVDEVPEAKFSYEISPMSVIVKKTGRRWYEFVTSLFGILGGTFTVVGFVDSALYRLLKPSTNLRS